ncbi:MAG: DUF998 domain-containing protein, partial [Acidobacteriia bacterium]|nr:DUF998 domain-containing protein [Terriglobia bacterium]
FFLLMLGTSELQPGYDPVKNTISSLVLGPWGWLQTIAFIALAAYSATQFFKVDQTRGQIMYAALFIMGAHGVGLMKIFAWEMLHRSSIRRDLRRVELRVAELGEMLKNR